MSRTSWSTVNQVSGQSPYTDELVKSAEQLVVVIKPLVEQKKYLKNFFDKACRSVICIYSFMARRYSPTAHSVILVKFTNSLVRSRPLKEIGAEQVITPGFKLDSSKHECFLASYRLANREGLSS
jgi:vacuolar protein sorting-associated protein 53